VNSSEIKAHALALGFDRCGIAPVGPFPEQAFLEQWLRRGYAGSMTWLARSATKRRHVRAAEPTAQSVIVTATVYNTDRVHTFERTGPRDAVVSRYAWGDDYHVVVRQRLDARPTPSRSTRGFTSTPGPSRNASTGSTQASGGSARTPASSIPSSARGFSSGA
jgi:epoxyqueuosine reductase QueG